MILKKFNEFNRLNESQTCPVCTFTPCIPGCTEYEKTPQKHPRMTNPWTTPRKITDWQQDQSQVDSIREHITPEMVAVRIKEVLLEDPSRYEGIDAEMLNTPDNIRVIEVATNDIMEQVRDELTYIIEAFDIDSLADELANPDWYEKR